VVFLLLITLSRGQSYKTSYGRNISIFVISYSLSLASFSSLVQCLWARPRTYPRVEHLKDASLRLAPALPANIRLGWKAARDQHSSLLGKSVNYNRKKFCRIGPNLPAKLVECCKGLHSGRLHSWQQKLGCQ
jgi:hypothetical protein